MKDFSAYFSIFLAGILVLTGAFMVPVLIYAQGANLTVTVLGNTECIDGIDNDSDGQTDYPADDGCTSTGDDDETDPAAPPPPSGGGGGGVFTPPPQTVVRFGGRAYPGSTVTLLKDAQVAASVIADNDAHFLISISGLAGGNYIFSIYSEDYLGIRSNLLTFPISVTQGATTDVSGIYIAPTIAVNKKSVRQGENIKIFGQTTPDSEVTISVNSHNELFVKTQADLDGIYLYNLDTSILEKEQHFTRSKSAINGTISIFSKVVSFIVGDTTIFKESGGCGKADLNCDGQVNLIDFSIGAFWYKRALSVEFAQKEIESLNGDGKVDLVDFSIMAFHWTG